MKLFTRCLFLLLVLALPLTSAFATTVTVIVGNNFYDPMRVNIRTGDVVRFVWQAGVHPTVSERAGVWQTFIPSASRPTTDITFNTAGSYPYYCSAHGAPGQPLGVGQNGLIVVTAATTTATIDPSLAAALTVYPNPSRGQVTVQLTPKPGADYKLRFSNIIGQEIRTVALRPELTVAGLPLDLSELRAGVYFYSLLVDGKVVSTKRLILQN